MRCGCLARGAPGTDIGDVGLTGCWGARSFAEQIWNAAARFCLEWISMSESGASIEGAGGARKSAKAPYAFEGKVPWRTEGFV